MRAATPDAVELMHRGILAFSRMEKAGILIDQNYLTKAIDRSGKKINRMQRQLKEDPIFRTWQKRFGHKTNLDSREQLEKIIFDEMGYKRTGRKTDKGADKADASAFEFVKLPFIDLYFKCARTIKARNTWLLGIQRELVNGRIHPFQDLHTAITYRPSTSRPNCSNWPVRDPIQASLVRRCIIAPPGFRVGEIDISGNEVCWSVVYHQDPQMRKYLEDPESDMHRDLAMKCFMLGREDVEKNEHDPKKLKRYCAKNKFVFPEFYGSYFMDCSKNLWDSIDLYDLRTKEGTPIKKHLKRKGIKELGETNSNWDTGRIETQKGTFVEHIRQVEKWFWEDLYQVYHQWKQDWYAKYCKRGWFPFKTGFVSRGLYNWKQVCNSPIQGSAFHGLLWSLIELQDWMIRKKLKSHIVNEIYDSMLIYLHHKEVDYVLEKAQHIMTKEVIKHWPFINVKLTVEAEVAPKGGSWNDKQPVRIAA